MLTMVTTSPIKMEHPQNVTSNSNLKSFIILFLIFFAFLGFLIILYANLPDFDEEEKKAFVLPKNIEHVKIIGTVLSKYTDSHFYPVVFGFFLTYVFLQAFSIPGSIFMSVLSGFLFPSLFSIFLVCLASSIGASFCYLLFRFFGSKLVWYYMPERASSWSEQVEKHKDHLINYMIFLRITPFLPNWFINIASPVINIPLHAFFIGSFIGVAPPSFLAIQAGKTLHQLTSSSLYASLNSFLVLAVASILSLLPIIYKRIIKEKFT